MYSEPWAKFTIRVTPKTIVSPLAMMNSDEALASPVSIWTTTKERSIRRQPGRAARQPGKGMQSPRPSRRRIMLTIAGAGPDLGGVPATVADRACGGVSRLVPYRLRPHAGGAEALIAHVPLIPVRACPEHDRPVRDHKGLRVAAAHLERIRPRLRSRTGCNPKGCQSRKPLPHRRGPPEKEKVGGTLSLARRLHLGLGEHHRRAVDVAPILHRALPALQRRLADPGAVRRLVVDAAHRDRADDGVELHVLEGRDQLLGVGAAGLLDQVLGHVDDDVAEERAEPRRVVELRPVGVDEGLVFRLGQLLPRVAGGDPALRRLLAERQEVFGLAGEEARDGPALEQAARVALAHERREV